jgi:hypothetical protein
MGTAGRIERIADAPPRFKTKTGNLFCLIILLKQISKEPRFHSMLR